MTAKTSGRSWEKSTHLTTQVALSLGMINPEDGRLWATPRANKTSGKDRSDFSPSLHNQVRMFPPPTANDAEKRGNIALERRNGLPAAVRLFPTATTRDYKGGYHTKSLTRKDGKSRAMDLLPNAVLDGKGSETVGGRLNPDWVEWLMGFPVGWTDLEVESPVQYDIALEPEIPRVNTKSEGRATRLKQMGNAFVPQVVEQIGKAIMQTKEGEHGERNRYVR